MPGRPSVMTNLSAVLIEQGRFADARVWCERVLEVEPENADALLNLSVCCNENGDTARAGEFLARLMAAHPAHTAARCNWGALLQEEGKTGEALNAYTQALAQSPDHPALLTGKAAVLLQLGRAHEALTCFKRVLRSNPQSPEARQGFVFALRSGALAVADFDDEVEALALAILRQRWLRPESMAHVFIGRLLIRKSFRKTLDRVAAVWPERVVLDELSDGAPAAWLDPLLCALLETTPIASIPIERLLTTLRYRLLQVIGKSGTVQEQDFHCALARQCFINEYIYPLAAGELELATQLRTRIESSVAAGVDFPEHWLAAAATYFPLHSLPVAGRLAEKRWSAAIDALVTQQVREPLAERAIRTEIPQLTKIEDEVSQKVRQQYEENPYPRWDVAGRPVKVLPFAPWSASRVGRVMRWQRNAGEPLAVLTAGCGSGRQAVETALQISGIDLLAVDLSLTSLAFAARKAKEAGVTNIQFAQADILRLASIGRRFDFIESTGVLHHMREPHAGLSVLAAILKDDGMMRLALYSEAARQSVVRVRQRIAEQGLLADEEGIRHCREMIASLDEEDPEREVVRFTDFYTMSECRDLLFHVEEHRFTLPALGAFLAGAGLELIGFELEPWQLAQFRTVFPGEDALGNLDSWCEFEKCNPDFFAAMYQFWVRKRR